jgi:hypothetical protein
VDRARRVTLIGDQRRLEEASAEEKPCWEHNMDSDDQNSEIMERDIRSVLIRQ